MPCICYVPKNFSSAHQEIIDQAVEIIEAYQSEGYILTLRQLYYQFVARDLLPNKDSEYKRLGNIISDARLAGQIDWTSIEDRTRGIRGLEHWEDGKSILSDAAGWFQIDRWADQPNRIEVWVEKEALAGVFARVCNRLDVSYLSCRGYTSQSEMWRAARRLNRYEQADQSTVILHFGDHDPSGLDMTRDIRDRLQVFECPVTVMRIALNMDQIEQYDPPPNPAKVTDSRAQAYIKQFGDQSWELDALEPAVLEQLVEDYVADFRDDDRWETRASYEMAVQNQIRGLVRAWEEPEVEPED